VIAGIIIKTPCQLGRAFLFLRIKIELTKILIPGTQVRGTPGHPLFSRRDEGLCASFLRKLAFEGPAAVVLGDGDENFIVPRVQVNGSLVVQVEDP